MIEIRCHTEDEGLVVEVVGDLTATSGRVLDSCLDAAIDADMTDLIVDVGSVRRIDRSVAMTLLELDRRLALVGGSLTLRNLDACVHAATGGVEPDDAPPQAQEAATG